MAPLKSAPAALGWFCLTSGDEDRGRGPPPKVGSSAARKSSAAKIPDCRRDERKRPLPRWASSLPVVKFEPEKWEARIRHDCWRHGDCLFCWHRATQPTKVATITHGFDTSPFARFGPGPTACTCKFCYREAHRRG